MNDIQKDQSAEQEKERLYSQYEKLIIRRDHELAALPNHEQKLLDK